MKIVEYVKISQCGKILDITCDEPEIWINTNYEKKVVDYGEDDVDIFARFPIRGTIDVNEVYDYVIKDGKSLIFFLLGFQERIIKVSGDILFFLPIVTNDKVRIYTPWYGGALIEVPPYGKVKLVYKKGESYTGVIVLRGQKIVYHAVKNRWGEYVPISELEPDD